MKKILDLVICKISESLNDWEADAQIQVSASRAAHVCSLPVNIKQATRLLADHYEDTVENAPSVFPELNLYTVCKANVSWNGCVFKNLKLFKTSMTPGTDHYFRNSFLLKQWLDTRMSNKYEEAALVYNVWAYSNYYHWIIESLPRLMILKKYHPKIELIIPYPTPGYVIKTLKIFGFEKFIYIKMGQVIKVENLIIPDKPSHLVLEDVDNGKNGFGLIGIRDYLLSKICKPNIAPFKLIYASRKRQSMRRISNEDEIECILKKHGFEIVFFEDMSFEVQVNLMQETSVLVGLHGANLANLMFMHPETKVIELMNIDSEKIMCYFYLASYFKILYYTALCYSVSYDSSNHSDVIVDPVELDRVISFALHNK